MQILVTGITGFVGSYLARLLLAETNVKLYGLASSAKNVKNISEFGKKITFYEASILDANKLKKILSAVKPDLIFHLAGQSSSRESFNFPIETFDTNVRGQACLFEVLRTLGMKPTIVVVGSSEEYGKMPKGQTMFNENSNLLPISPYGVSKVAQDLMAYQYFASFGFKTIRLRAFSHTGPGQQEDFVASNFAKQIALMEAKKIKPVLRVGNLDLTRDFTDVRDIVRAYWLAAHKAQKGEAYNVCSGKPIKLNQMVEIYLKHAKVKITVKKDPGRLRAIDIPLMVGDPTKIMHQTGWKPQIAIEKTFLDILKFWRHQVAAS